MRLEPHLALETICPFYHPAQLQNQYPSPLLMKFNFLSKQLRKIMGSFLFLEPGRAWRLEILASLCSPTVLYKLLRVSCHRPQGTAHPPNTDLGGTWGGAGKATFRVLSTSSLRQWDPLLPKLWGMAATKVAGGRVLGASGLDAPRSKAEATPPRCLRRAGPASGGESLGHRTPPRPLPPFPAPATLPVTSHLLTLSQVYLSRRKCTLLSRLSEAFIGRLQTF